MSDRDIVFIPGIWMPGISMRPLANKLRSAHGYRGHLFGYASVTGTVDENAALLADFIDDLQLRGAHLVGHSLGGVVALRMLHRCDDVRGARLVCLGSPLGGSRAAARLAQYRWGRAITGKTLAGGVLEHPAAEWASGVTDRCDIACIAGTMPMGTGRLLATFDDDNDGTVAVSETRLAGAREHLCLPVNHTGLLLSPEVARQVAAFLARGEFQRSRGAMPRPPANRGA